MATPTYADRMSEQYARRIDSIAHQLRALADTVEREGEPRPQRSHHSLPPHMNSAQRVIHEVTWGVANLSLSTLLDTAHDADSATQADGEG